MKVSRTWLQTFFDKEIPQASELAELFTFHSCEVEGIEKTVDGDVLDLKILPDRAHYCLSHRGIAEEIHVITGQPLKNPREIPPTPIANASVAAPKVTLKTSPAELDSHGLFCRRYMARRIENITVGESPEWMKNHLVGIGERSINSIVDATNIIMFDIGQPLHAFDADVVKGDIVVRAAAEGEKIILLDGKEVVLKATDHVIADEDGALAIAGVKGGKRAQVTSATKNLIIESANFDPSSVRRTATRLNLRNESSKRFENEITSEFTADGINYVSGLIAMLAPTSAGSMSEIVDIYPAKPEHTVTTVTRAYVNDRLGIEVPEKDFYEIIARLGITAQNDGQSIHLTIPHHRLDLTIADDIVEEIGRVYGYEKIQTHLPAPQEKGVAILPSFYLAEKIKNILSGAGFSEVNLYTLVSKGIVETAYPLASDKSFARANLADNMLASLERNALNADLLGLDAIKMFEIGRIFTAQGEFATLALGAVQVKKIKGVKSDTILTEAVELLSKELGTAIPAGKIISKGIHSVLEIDLDEIVKSYKLPATVTYADLGFGPATSTIFKKFSIYPFITRDIAVFTPDTIEAAGVWTTIKKGITDAKGDTLLARHALFDTFKKDGKVSYAFRMVFQSMEKTLTDDQVGAIMQSVYAQMKEKGWEVR